MKYLAIIGFVFMIFGYNAQVSVFSCSAVNPTVSQAEIDNNDDYYKQCILFDNNESHNFNTDDTKIVTALSEIHIKEDFHAGQFDPNAGMHLRLEEKSSFDVIATEYNDLNSVGLHNRFELGIELPSAIGTSVNNFVEDLAGKKINPYLDWEIRVYATFEHSNLPNPIEVDGFYMKEFDSYEVAALPTPANNYAYNTTEYKSLGGYTESNTNTSNYNFRIRFAPNQLGAWKAQIHIVTPTETIHSAPFIFNVAPSSNKGYMRAGANNRFFRVGNEPFYPVGTNIPWPTTNETFDPELQNYIRKNDGSGVFSNEQYRDWYLTPRVYDKYHDAMNLLKDNGGNMLRMIMYPAGTQMEWEKLGDYTDRLHMGQELDEILELAENRGLYLLWNFQIHFTFQNSANAYFSSWAWDSDVAGSTQCYKTLMNTNNPVDFFTHEEAKKYYKQRLRYILARWGYSTNVGIFELFSEISNVGAPTNDDNAFYLQGNNWQIYTNWQVEMADYIKSHHNGKIHLLTPSYAGQISDLDNIFQNNSLDVMGSNIYDFADPSYSRFWTREVAERHLNDNFGQSSYTARLAYGLNGTELRITKPLIYSETGTAPLDNYCLNDETEMKRAMWQSTFSGLALGFGWTEWTRTNAYNTYGQINSVIQGIDLDGEKWHPGAIKLRDNFGPYNWDGAWVYKVNYKDKMMGENRKADLSYLRSGDRKFAMGVITNTTYNVYNTSDCYDDLWDVGSDPNETPSNELWSQPITPSEEVNTAGNGSEKLKLKGVSGGKYVIDYYLPSNLSAPIATSENNGPNVKIDYDNLGITDNTYIIFFKARRKNQNWAPEFQDSIAEIKSGISNSLKNEVNVSISSNKEEIQLFPIPSSDIVKISIPGSKEVVRIEVLSKNGKAVQKLNTVQKQIELNISSFENGVYFVHFYLKDRSSLVKKIVKL